MAHNTDRFKVGDLVVWYEDCGNAESGPQAPSLCCANVVEVREDGVLTDEGEEDRFLPNRVIHTVDEMADINGVSRTPKYADGQRVKIKAIVDPYYPVPEGTGRVVGSSRGVWGWEYVVDEDATDGPVYQDRMTEVHEEGLEELP